MTRVLGVDPTATGSGAAVLRVAGRVARTWAWTLLSGGWRVRTDGVDSAVRFASLSDAIDVVILFLAIDLGETRALRDVRLVVEGLHVPPRWARRASGADVLVLAEATGATIARFRAAGFAEPTRPTAKEWRGPFGWAGLDAKRAEAAAVALAMREGWLPRGLTGAESGAVAEAGAMATFGGAS